MKCLLIKHLIIKHMVVQIFRRHVNYKPEWFIKNSLFGLVLVSLFNGVSNFVGYLMPKPSLWKNRVVLFNTYLRDKRTLYLPQGYLSESERNSATGFRTR